MIFDQCIICSSFRLCHPLTYFSLHVLILFTGTPEMASNSRSSGSEENFSGFNSEQLQAVFDKHTEQNNRTSSTSGGSEMDCTDILSSSSEEKRATVIKSDVTIVTEKEES